MEAPHPRRQENPGQGIVGWDVEQTVELFDALIACPIAAPARRSQERECPEHSAGVEAEVAAVPEPPATQAVLTVPEGVAVAGWVNRSLEPADSDLS